MNYVPLTQISDNPFQSSRDYSDIEELAGRIAAALDASPDTYGLLQIPLGRLILPDGSPHLGHLDPDQAALKLGAAGWRVELAFGHRRLRAFMYLELHGPELYDLAQMPVNLQSMTDQDMIDAVWAENNDRKDVTAVERAELLAMKLEQVKAGGGSQRDVAEAWGMKRASVANELRLLKLPAAIQNANRAGTISARQAHSLANAATMVNMGVNANWSHRTGWNQNAISPHQLIDQVIEDPDSWSSNQIRKESKAQLKLAGQALPSSFSKHVFEELVDVMRQPACRGCPQRLADYCFDNSCLILKKSVWHTELVIAAAAELGYEMSAAASHFPTDQYQKAAAIRAIHENGGCEHMRVGAGERYCVRPWSVHHDGEIGVSVDYPTRADKGGPYVAGDRSLVILGHKGNPLTCEITMSAATAEQKELDAKDAVKFKVPDKPVRDARTARVKKDGKALEKRIQAAVTGKLVDQLADVPTAWPALHSIMRVIKPGWSVADKTYEQATAGLVSNAFESCKDGLSGGYYEAENYLKAREILEDAGLDPNLADPEDGAEAMALELLRPLVQYYQNYRYMMDSFYSWQVNRVLPVFTAALVRMEDYSIDHGDEPAGEMAELWAEVLEVHTLLIGLKAEIEIREAEELAAKEAAALAAKAEATDANIERIREDGRRIQALQAAANKEE